MIRPWRDYGVTACIRCTLDNHITPKGWSEWGGREAACRAVEYGGLQPDGLPLSLSQRAGWVKVLSESQAAQYTLANILGGWNPTDHPFAAPPLSG